MQTIRFLGIHSSPLKKGNTAWLLDYALAEAAACSGVDTEAIALAGLHISDCLHCNWCMKKQTSERLCSIEDDASEILKKIAACDILLLASPVYFARLSGTMACLIDRTRCLLFGREERMALKWKVGIALAVGWSRNGGIETTLESIHSAFLLHEMWTPSVHAAGAIFGVGAVSGPLSPGEAPGGEIVGVKGDVLALRATSLLVKRAVETARLLQNG